MRFQWVLFLCGAPLGWGSALDNLIAQRPGSVGVTPPPTDGWKIGMVSPAAGRVLEVAFQWLN